MDEIKKQLRRLQKKDYARVRLALEQVLLGEGRSLDRQKLKGYENIFRIRVGSYRIIYFDDGHEIDIKAIKKRDERTYSDF